MTLQCLHHQRVSTHCLGRTAARKRERNYKVNKSLQKREPSRINVKKANGISSVGLALAPI